MSIHKVAKLFKGKLALASSKLSEDLKKVMVSTSDLMKNYGSNEDNVYSAAQNLWYKAYQCWKLSTNSTQMIPSATVSGWVQSLKEAATNVPNDPKISAKMSMINNLIASIQPMDIWPDSDGNTYNQEQNPPAQENEGVDAPEEVTPPAAPPPPAGAPEVLNPQWKYVPHKW